MNGSPPKTAVAVTVAAVLAAVPGALLSGCYTEIKGRPRPDRDARERDWEQRQAIAKMSESARLEAAREAREAAEDAKAAAPAPAATGVRSDPGVPRANKATFVAAGLRQTCAVQSEGIVCWGRAGPKPPEGEFLTVSVGAPNACALDKRGGVRCWGENTYGALGDGTIDVHREPVTVVDLEDATALGVGYYASCAVRRSGRVACWGRNSRGALGDGTEITHRTATAVPGLSGVAEIAGGEDFFCARLHTGDVSCWGDGRLGQGGDKKATEKSDKRNAIRVPSLKGIVSLAAGRHHVCAADSLGIVRCWGLGVNGVLGARSTSKSDLPVEVPDLDGVVEVSATETMSCARRKNGEVWCWGQVPFTTGDRGVVRPHDPRAVPGLVDAVQIAASEGSICARQAGGAIVCVTR